MTVFDIKIASDIICPWCYLGTLRLHRAVDLFRRTFPGGKHDTFNIMHLPYLINPDAPYPSVPMQEKMEGRMGAERTKRAQEHMARLGVVEGVRLSFGGWVGRSRDAWRLVGMAVEKDNTYEERGEEDTEDDGRLQDKVIMELYRAYSEEEKDVADIDVLVDVGVKMGLCLKEEVKEWLESDKGGKEVDAISQELKANGVKGVPWFEIQGRHIVDGAADSGDFYELFIKIKEEEQGVGSGGSAMESETISGATCTPGGLCT